MHIIALYALIFVTKTRAMWVDWTWQLLVHSNMCTSRHFTHKMWKLCIQPHDVTRRVTRHRSHSYIRTLSDEVEMVVGFSAHALAADHVTSMAAHCSFQCKHMHAACSVMHIAGNVRLTCATDARFPQLLVSVMGISQASMLWGEYTKERSFSLMCKLIDWRQNAYLLWKWSLNSKWRNLTRTAILFTS